MKDIFDPAQLGKLVVKNRLVRSATWEDMATWDGGIPIELMEIYQELAKGGVGTIITGFTSVAQEDFYFEGMMRIGDDKLIPQYRLLTETVHKHDSKILMQLALGGYYERMPGDRYAVFEPDQLNKIQIDRIISMFGESARRAQVARFDGVQIHAAHFFFLSRFISPVWNHRNDEYGGNLEGRVRILKEIIKEIRFKAPLLHISMKINATDFAQGGLSIADSVQIAKILQGCGLESIEVSANGTSVAGIKAGVNEGYFFEYGKVMADNLSIPVILVGGHRSVETMNKFINVSKISFLSLSRPLIREPGLPKRWKEGDVAPAKCISCNACYSTKAHKCIFAIEI